MKKGRIKGRKYTAVERKLSKQLRNKLYYTNKMISAVTIAIAKRMEILEEKRYASQGFKPFFGEVRKNMDGSKKPKDKDSNSYKLSSSGVFENEEDYKLRDFRDVLIELNMEAIADDICKNCHLGTLQDYKDKILQYYSNDPEYVRLVNRQKELLNIRDNTKQLYEDLRK